jgi:hypothetical protein
VKKLLVEGAASSVSADCGSSWCDSRTEREVFEGSFLEVDFLKESTVGRLKFVDGFVHATAKVRRCVWRGDRVFSLGRPVCKSAIFNGAVAIVIDDCVAKDAEEPGIGALG